jgi:hypothetical protein
MRGPGAVSRPFVRSAPGVPDDWSPFIYKMCLNSIRTLCIMGQGAGSQVIISVGVPSYFSLDNLGTWTPSGTQLALVFWQNQNGYCLREGSDRSVKLQNGACTTGTQDNEWGEDRFSAPPYTELNRQHTSDYAAVYTPSSGDPVWGNPPGTGWYTGWFWTAYQQ